MRCGMVSTPRKSWGGDRLQVAEHDVPVHDIVPRGVAVPAVIQNPLLRVVNLRTEFVMAKSVVHAVRGATFDIYPGEAVGLVGESGSGKSISALSIIGLIKPPGRIVSGSVTFQGRDLVRVSRKDMRYIRGKEIGFIFQDPMTHLNPVLTIGRQITEAVRAHLGLSAAAARARALELMDLVELPHARSRFDNYPHQFSGGMRQRVLIAIAISCNPKLLIADEPTTALDVTVQAQILDLVNRLRSELGMAILIITHDMGVIAGIANRVAVMYAGRIVELANVDDVFLRSRHPYTRALLKSIPRVDHPVARALHAIPGQPPDPTLKSAGCMYRLRCKYRLPRCEVEVPQLEMVTPMHAIACFADISQDSGEPAPDLDLS